MNGRRWERVGWIGLAVMIAAGVTAWHWRASARSSAALAADWDRKTRALDEMMRAEEQKAEVRTRVERGAATPSRAPAGAALAFGETPKVEAKTASAAAAPRTLSIAHLIRNEPDAQVLYLASQRAALMATYGPLFRQLGLGAEQVTAFQDNVIRQREQFMDLENMLRQGEIEAATLEQLRKNEAARFDAAQRELLGEDGYRRWRDYERTSWVRGIVSAIAGVAVVENAPLTAQQADLLVQIIAQTSESYRRGGDVRTMDVDWKLVEAQARTLLSPEQFEIFRTMDPGPTRPGLLQTRLYAEVERANEAEKEKRESEAAARPRS